MYLYFFRPNAKSSWLSPYHGHSSQIVGVGRLVCQSYFPKPATGPQFEVALQQFDQTILLGPRVAEKTAHRKVYAFTRIVKSPGRSILAVLKYE